MTQTEIKQAADHAKRDQARRIVSAVLDDGTIVETVFEKGKRETKLCIFRNGEISYAPFLDAGGVRLTPYSAENNLLVHEVLLLPSEAAVYESVPALVSEIQEFIHSYVDLSEAFERIAAYYVLFSWVHDAFQELPYLRLRGEPGSGKSRCLLTVGALCYKPMFASGASTVSPLFRIIDSVRGTLIMDEADFRLSDERAEIVKILNNGNGKGFPVLRSEVTAQKEFNPTAYTVFGPKIVATRGAFTDEALESRCLTEEMGQRPLRRDIPINLPAAQKSEALGLRNKLLSFRFATLNQVSAKASLVDRAIDPRLNQVLVPLLSIIEDEATRGEIRELARVMQSDRVTQRGTSAEAQVLEILKDGRLAGNAAMPVKEIAEWFSDRHADDYERKVTPKWIGWILRQRLRLRTEKRHGAFVIPESEAEKLALLYERYGIETEASETLAAENPTLS